METILLSPPCWEGETSTCFSDSDTCSVSSAPTLSLTGGLSLTAKSFALHSSSHGWPQPSCIQDSSITAQAKERGSGRMQRKELGGAREGRKTSLDQINATVSTSDKSCLGSSLLRA